MKRKKLIATFLLFTSVTLFFTNTCVKGESLYDFFQTTNRENINARMEYPSMPKQIITPRQIKLPANTPVIIKSNETVSTRDVVSGSTVKFTVLQDVKSADGMVLIKSGTPVSAQIVFAKDRGRIGSSGQITISDFHTTAIDGTYVPLSGTVAQHPDDKMVLSICLGVIICPLFLLMRGEDAQVPAGTTKNSYTASDVYIKI